MSLVSSHRILPIENTSRDHIHEVDQIDPENTHSSCDLATTDDSERRNQESEHDRPWVAHDHSSRYISSCQIPCDRDDDSEDSEEESAILLAGDRRIREIEFHGESGEYDECDESKSARQTWDSVGEVHSIEHNDIPEDRDEYWYPIDRHSEFADRDDREELIEWEYSPEYIAHIWDLDTRYSDDSSDSDLHQESYDGWYFDATLADCIEIVYERYYRDDDSDDEDDHESLLEETWESCKIKHKWREYEQCDDDRYSCSIWCRGSSHLTLVEIRAIE